jgi:hypothetical protein
LGLGHAGRDASGVFVDGKNFFQGRLALKNRNRSCAQFGFGAQNRGYGKIRHVDAGKGHDDIESLSD